jgi:hypothetical protein
MAKEGFMSVIYSRSTRPGLYEKLKGALNGLFIAWSISILSDDTEDCVCTA